MISNNLCICFVEISWFMILTFLFLRENWIVCMKNRMFLDMCCHMTVYLFFQWLHIKFGWVIEGIIILESAKIQNTFPRRPELYFAQNFLESAHQCQTDIGTTIIIVPKADGFLCSLFGVLHWNQRNYQRPYMFPEQYISFSCSRDIWAEIVKVEDDDFVLVVWPGAGMWACWDQARSCCAARGCKHCKEHASVENIEPCTSPAGLWSSLWRYTRRLAVEDCQGGVVLPAVGKSSGTGTGRQRGHLLARPFSEDRCARIKDAYFLA